MSELKTWKIVFEVRYPASSALFDNRGKIASNWQWKNDLSEWRISNNQVSIHNKSGSKFLNAGFKNITVVTELPENQSEFDSLASEFSTNILNLLQVKKIERIGLRYIRIAKHQHFRLLVTKMKEKLFRLEDKDWSIFEGNAEDIGFPLTIDYGDKKANITMGPMKSDQLATFFEANDVKKKLPSVAVFFDFDFFKTEPDFSTEEYKEQIDSFIKINGEKITQITNNILHRFGEFK